MKHGLTQSSATSLATAVLVLPLLIAKCSGKVSLCWVVSTLVGFGWVVEFSLSNSAVMLVWLTCWTMSSNLWAASLFSSSNLSRLALWSSADDSSDGNESINTSTSLAVRAISWANRWVWSKAMRRSLQTSLKSLMSINPTDCIMSAVLFHFFFHNNLRPQFSYASIPQEN